MRKFSRFLAMFLVIVTVTALLPIPASAAPCSHNWKKKYTIENEKMHSYISKCSKCGEEKNGWGYAGWEDHSYSNSVCVCGHKEKKACTHSSTSKVYKYENGNQHSYDSKCNNCGQALSGWGYSGWENHSFSGNSCSKCGYTKSCTHSNNTRKYSNLSATQHKTWQHCNSCGIDYNTQTVSHSWNYGSWSSISDSQHQRTLSCACGASKTEKGAHSFSGNACSSCVYKKSSGGGGSGGGGSTPTPTPASVTLSATGPSGTLGSAGGEITAESVPASYTVTAKASGTTVTKIEYTMNGRTYSTTNSSVTITASKESDFTSTAFVAYTAAGVKAAFTVNFKYVRHATSYYMWNTYQSATIRSITGPGVNKTLSYTMDLPNSYSGQGNLSDSQVATLLSLIGKADGNIYTINYTRVIRVYSPAELTWNHQEIVHGYFDGNSDSEINTCISSWDWNPSTKEAIRQAAKSSLTFTANPVGGGGGGGETPTEPNCTAIWINTSTGRELYRTSSFHVTGTVTTSSSAVVSISYSDYSGSSSYVYDYLTYSGDRSGSSTSQTYSQSYTKDSKPLTVTFYCHEKAVTPTSGSITVRAIDGDTEALISSAAVKLDSTAGSGNPASFTNVSFGAHTASASASGYSPASENVTISSGSPNKTVTLRLYKSSGDVTVIVRDSSNREVIAGASVSGAGKSGTTGSNGRVSFSGVSFGTHTFSASKNGYSSGSASAAISASSTSTTITIYLDPLPTTGDITVRVLDRNTGNPIGSASVSGAGRNRTTGSDGRTVFSGLSFGSYSFTASKSGYYDNSGSGGISVGSPTDTVTIYLTPKPTSGDITVRVLDRNTNSPISSASVTSGVYSRTTGSDGRTVFDNLPFGSYSFTASKSGYYSNSASGTITQTSVSATVTIYLTPIPTSGDITVYVRDADNNALLPGARVSGGSVNGTTDAGGKLVFTDLPFRTYTFTAELEGYCSGSVSASISETSVSATATIYLRRQRTDLTVEGLLNGTLYKGSEIMVSAKVKNDGDIDLTPDKLASVTMTAKKADGSVFDTQDNDVIIPANGENLTWFTVTVPDTSTVTFDFHVTAPDRVEETNLSNNDDSVNAPVSELPVRECEDADATLDPPEDFTYEENTDDEEPELTWDVWEWEDGFVKKTYHAKLVMSPVLIPDETAGYREEIGGVWVTRSGYGVDTETEVSVESNFDEIAGSLKVDTFYPEHVYSTAASKSDRLEEISGAYVFRPLASSVSGARMHTIPLWFPDRPYTVKYIAYDVWCPAGMLSGKSHARVSIDGDMYDDLYTQ